MPDPIENQPRVIEVDEFPTAVIADVVATVELPTFFDRSFSTLPAVLAAQGVSPVGPAFARHHRPVSDTADLAVGFPVNRPVAAQDGVEPSTLPGGQAARLVHHGGFDGLPGAWERLAAWIDEQGLSPGTTMWEVYVTEPSPDMDPADLRTELNWLLESESPR